jgi:hypothetical protein
MPETSDITTTLDTEEEPLLPTTLSTRTLAEDRNERRFQSAQDDDQHTISKYLPNTPTAFLPPPILGPRDAFEAPLELITAVAEIARMPSPTPAASPIHFAISPTHLAANTQLLAAENYNITNFWAKHQHTTLGFGSEFRPIAQLRRVLGNHPHFSALASILENG